MRQRLNPAIPQAYLELERITFFNSQAVGLGNDRNDVDNFAQLLHDNDVDRAKRMSCWVNEIEATVDSRVLDVAVAHSSKLFAQVRAVLVLDVFDDGIPTANAFQGLVGIF